MDLLIPAPYRSSLRCPRPSGVACKPVKSHRCVSVPPLRTSPVLGNVETPLKFEVLLLVVVDEG